MPEDLRQRIRAAHADIVPRLRACARAGGGPFKHMLRDLKKSKVDAEIDEDVIDESPVFGSEGEEGPDFVEECVYSAIEEEALM